MLRPSPSLVSIGLGVVLTGFQMVWPNDGSLGRAFLVIGGLLIAVPIVWWSVAWCLVRFPILVVRRATLTRLKAGVDEANASTAEARRAAEERVRALKDRMEVLRAEIKAEMDAPAAIAITLADPPDETAEAYLEWPHLLVKNTSLARLTSVRATALITGEYGGSGTVVNLRWDPDEEGLVVLEQHEKRTIPLCIRSREDGKSYRTSRRGTVVPLAQWNCYMTEEAFLLSGGPVIHLQEGKSDLRIRVTYGDNGMVEAWFRVYVPRRIEGQVEKHVWVVALPPARSNA